MAAHPFSRLSDAVRSISRSHPPRPPDDLALRGVCRRYLGSNDEVDGAPRAGSRDRRALSKRPRLSRRYAPCTTCPGEIDVGIAWCLKALRSEPEDDESRTANRRAVLEDRRLSPGRDHTSRPRRFGRLWLERRYGDLIDAAQILVDRAPGEFPGRVHACVRLQRDRRISRPPKYLLRTNGHSRSRPTRDTGDGMVPQAYDELRRRVAVARRQ